MSLSTHSTSAKQDLREQFLHPSNEFTPVPFWFWNDDLSPAEILRQIADFADKGVMGFVIHPRIGLPETIPYMSDTYLDLVETAVKDAYRRGMTVILYDEAMYPSGAANGLVVKGDPAFASRGLKMVELGCEKPVRLSDVLEDGDVLVSAQAVRRTGDKPDWQTLTLLEPAEGQVSLQREDSGDWTMLLFIETFSRGTIRGIHFGEDDGEPNAPAAADLMNPLATAKFIRLTHDKYYERLKDYFGTTIQAMFTDEPDLLGRRHRKGLRAWTEGFLGYFLQEGCAETDLPLLWMDGESSDEVRRRYRKAVNKRMVAAYYKPLSDWCEQHGIALTGHPAQSDEIGLLEHFHIPGQDVVWRWVAPEDGKAIEGRHTTMAKCSSDAARHRGRRRNLNEMLGVCSPGGGWALHAGDMKWYMDWLLVRGVNYLCPHAFYYSIDGPRRINERPPDVGPNNIWWPHYTQFADYMKRMSWIMTDSANVTPIAVLGREDWLPWKAVKPLYEHQREFNYLEESLLAGACTVSDGQIRIANQTYTVVIVENDGLWEEETGRILSQFIEQGGSVIQLQTGEARRTMPATAQAAAPEQIVAELDRLFAKDAALEPACPDIRVSHVVKEDNHFYVVVNEGEQAYDGSLSVGVSGRAELWKPWEAEISEADAYSREGRTVIDFTVERRQCLVFRVDPSAAPGKEGLRREKRPVVSYSRRLSADTWNVEAPQLTEHALTLGSWTEREGWEHFSGTVTYSNKFPIDETKSPDRRVVLDLGEAHEMAEVWINGQWAGVRMWHPYSFDIGPLLQPGTNELRVAVTNSLANRVDRVKLPSGLIGPVTIAEFDR
ncbi:glycosylhydrolase-like jelly roll fold domain-containing protein [Paenibacillus sp. NPDC056579]|uniref:glycosylhydrolase-like jelly roll fold domain-containing protein n=1 Tax=Paenibacillus sp. NPDC056579 TaxID=3345871 RepID=UPI00369136FC